MVLHVDDVGCVPDGRFLEQVAIDPGSAVLNVPGGGLRSTDTGKNVVVPGAVDLVATIGLAKLKEVKNASMALDDPTRLTGTLIDPAKPAGKQEEDFVPAAHEGRRITVARAGPGVGAPLRFVQNHPPADGASRNPRTRHEGDSQFRTTEGGSSV